MGYVFLGILQDLCDSSVNTYRYVYAQFNQSITQSIYFHVSSHNGVQKLQLSSHPYSTLAYTNQSLIETSFQLAQIAIYIYIVRTSAKCFIRKLYCIFLLLAGWRTVLRDQTPQSLLLRQPQKDRHH